jgi:hypothetical protein
MIGFLLKKTFYDLWDNMFKIALLNLGFILSLSLGIAALSLALPFTPLAFGVLLIGTLWCAAYLNGAARCLARVSGYGSLALRDFPGHIRKALPASLLLGGLLFLTALILGAALPFYLAWGSLLGAVLGAFSFWTAAAMLLALQFFPAAGARLGARPAEGLKKCAFFFFDNPLFCMFALFHNALLLALSLFLLLLFPGPAGILLFLDEALRLRLLKYTPRQDPAAARGPRKIPWESLLAEEREKTGSRSLRSFIFPWKD